MFTLTAAARPLDKEVSALVALVVSENITLLKFTTEALVDDKALDNTTRVLISDARPTDNEVSAFVALVVSATIDAFAATRPLDKATIEAV